MQAEEYARRLNELFRGTLMESQGIRLMAAHNGHAAAELAMSPAVAQPTGLFHAGAIAALADTTATAAGLSLTDPDGEGRREFFPLAIQISGNLVGNSREGKLISNAELIHHGRTTMVASVRIEDAAGKLVANFNVTLLAPPASARTPVSS